MAAGASDPVPEAARAGSTPSRRPATPGSRAAAPRSSSAARPPACTTARAPPDGRDGDRLASLTVVGPSLAWADAYATAGFVLGDQALDWVDRRPGYAGLAIGDDRIARWTPDLD